MDCLRTRIVMSSTATLSIGARRAWKFSSSYSHVFWYFPAVWCELIWLYFSMFVNVNQSFLTSCLFLTSIWQFQSRLNRGNHEDSVMNHRYGFTREVQQKYRNNSEKLLKLIDQVFRHLPLGTLINNKIFVVHGGISETTDLNLIASVRRSKVKL